MPKGHLTSSPTKSGQSPKKSKNDDEEQHISLNVEIPTKADRKYSNDTEKQYFVKKGTTSKELLKSVKESFASTSKKMSKVSGLSNDILDNKSIGGQINPYEK